VGARLGFGSKEERSISQKLNRYMDTSLRNSKERKKKKMAHGEGKGGGGGTLFRAKGGKKGKRTDCL